MRRFSTFHVDLFGPIFLAYVILMMCGVIELSGLTVGIGLLLSQCHLTYTWHR